MAKKKVRPRRGALSELLRNRGMTQVDAAERTGSVDRKTLAKINRGEEVKLETLQKVTTTLRVLVSYFEETSPAADQTGGSFGPTDTVMLRKLNAKRLAELIKGAEWRVELELNFLVIDNNVRALLRALWLRVHLLSLPKVGQSRARTMGAKASPSSTGLDYELSQLKAVDSLADLLQELGKHRLAVLGAEYLRWTRCRSEKNYWPLSYTSERHVLLSVEPSSTQSRRVQIDPGAQPPKSRPYTEIVYVDSCQLELPEDHPEMARLRTSRKNRP